MERSASSYNINPIESTPLNSSGTDRWFDSIHASRSARFGSSRLIRGGRWFKRGG